MADQEVKIKVTATGADKAAKEIGKIADATEDLNQATEETSEAQAEAAEEIDKATESLKDQLDAERQAVTQKDELKRSLGAVQREYEETSFASKLLGSSTAIAAGALGTLAVAAGGAMAAAAGARAVLEASGSDEAIAELDANAEAWAKLAKAAGDAKTSLAGAAEPLAAGVLSTATMVIDRLAKDLNAIMSMVGLGRDNPEERFAADNAAREERAKAREERDRIAKDRADAAYENSLFGVDLDEERIRRQREIDERQAREAEKAAEENAAREAAAQERIFEATLSQEENLKRKMGNLKGSGPFGADAINSLPPGSAARASAAERTAEITQMERQLAEIREAKRQEAARKAAEQRRKALEDQAAAARGGLNASAREQGLRITGSTPGQTSKTLAGIGQKLIDGTDAAELKRIGDQIDLKQKELGQVNVKALQKILAELQAQAAKITALEGQIKTSRITR